MPIHTVPTKQVLTRDMQAVSMYCLCIHCTFTLNIYIYERVTPTLNKTGLHQLEMVISEEKNDCIFEDRGGRTGCTRGARMTCVVDGCQGKVTRDIPLCIFGSTNDSLKLTGKP